MATARHLIANYGVSSYRSLSNRGLSGHDIQRRVSLVQHKHHTSKDEHINIKYTTSMYGCLSFLCTRCGHFRCPEMIRVWFGTSMGRTYTPWILPGTPGRTDPRGLEMGISHRRGRKGNVIIVDDCGGVASRYQRTSLAFDDVPIR